METILLSLTIISLCSLMAYEKHLNRLERNKLINALISKSPEDMVTLQLADKPQPKMEKQEPDLIPESDLSEEQLKELIKNEII